jgi:hypothetical protein
MTLAGQIRDCFDIPHADKRRALLELHKMQTDVRYAWKVRYAPTGLRTAFVWDYTDAGTAFWQTIHTALLAQANRNELWETQP